MTSELCLHRRLNTLQIVCSTAPLPSAECQDSSLLPRAHIFPSDTAAPFRELPIQDDITHAVKRTISVYEGREEKHVCSVI